ncbi:hypothetical protein CASFOL_008436 [Castilleja foliolosa]|uniref:Uncharacterized protein n=1 Tax=Castilleja foliolosa TaxID=1961234 RepID=A0ABD3DYZ5_9LAMI
MRSKNCLFILLTCFFMHASYSRHIGLTNYKDFHKPKLSHKRIGLNLVSSNARGTIDRSTSAIISKSKEYQLDKGAINSGNQDGKACLHVILENATKTKGSRFRQLMNIKQNVLLSSEDLFETDYQPPRRKSPIHN